MDSLHGSGLLDALAVNEPPMSDLFWLTDEQKQRIEPCFPLSHGVQRVDDRRIVSGTILVTRNGLRWRVRQRRMGRPRRSTTDSSAGAGWGCSTESLPAGGRWRIVGSVDDRCQTYESAPDGHQPAQKGALFRCIGRTKASLYSKLYAGSYGRVRPRIMSPTPVLRADRGYDADWFRQALAVRATAA